ncbi:MAG: glycogen debranching N-terminal domain-containing protein [Vicinamibacterales bacterium]
MDSSVDDIIRINDRYYILATSSRTDERALVLKHGDSFGVFDHYGDIVPFGLGEQGLYHDGTRYLSRFELRIDQRRPLLLSSTVKQENELLTVDLTNPDILGDGQVRIPRDTLHVFRSRFLWQEVCYERWRISNHGLAQGDFAVELVFDSDFADIFEVRGTPRAHRGQVLPVRVEERAVALSYRGLDDVLRTTWIALSERPASLTPLGARFELHLEPQSTFDLSIAISCGVPAKPGDYDDAFRSSLDSLAAAGRQQTDVAASNHQFNDWINRSSADLHMMITELPDGPYPYAGVPWFSTPFGRDGIITSLEMLWAYPDIAKGVLRYLAANQAVIFDPACDAEPGKILHEARGGEMAALGEIPFSQYYGSVDSTPLFVMLAGAYYRRTDDGALIEEIWPSIERALEWIDKHGDLDGDGFVEYSRRSVNGLVQQGWKDSNDSVFHADGRIAEPPIALCEVQAYVYEAKRQAANLAIQLGHTDRAEQLLEQARSLREQFEKHFWCEEIDTYALALDGRKQPCAVRSSNAGQCLYSEIASPARGARVAQSLFNDTLFTGWGIRTLDGLERRFNPMSYHNGSVWPHDNAIIAAGLARYERTDLAARLLESFFEASQSFDLRRMPELFCGFRRRAGVGPTRYPVACAPQSWAAGAVFMLLEACLGLRIDAPARRIVFSRPVLPPFLDRLSIENLRIGPATLDLVLDRSPHDVGVTVLRRSEDIQIVVLK